MERVFFYLLSFIIEAVILLQYASHLFKSKHSTRSRGILLASLYSFLFFIALFDINWLNMCLYFAANVVFILTQYNIRILPAFFHSAIITAIMAMCELMVYGIINRFAPNFFIKMESFHNTAIFIICSKTLFFFLIFLITIIIKNHKKEDNNNENTMLPLSIVPIASAFIMVTFVNISDKYVLSPMINWMISLSALFLLAINLLIFGINLYNQKKNREYTDMQLLLQKETDITEYYRDLLSQNENQSILIHDIKKHIQSIIDLSEQNNINGINEYAKELLSSSALKESNRVCDVELLNAILSRYKRQCNEKGISLTIDIRSGVVNFLSDSEITSLFCNLLDNAIESSEKIQDSYIEISIYKKNNSPFIIVSVINSCRINPFSDSGNYLSTTKQNKKKHGFGLKSIRKVLENHQGDMQMYYDDCTHTFHTIITLKNDDVDNAEGYNL